MLKTALRKSRQYFAVGESASSPPAARATEASMTSRFERFTDAAILPPPQLRRIQVTAFCFKGNFGKIFRPLPKGAGLVKISSSHFSTAIIPSSEPMQLNFFWSKFPFRHQRLNP